MKFMGSAVCWAGTFNIFVCLYGLPSCLCAKLHLRSSPAAPRLHIVSVTGTPNYDMALKMEQAWKKYLGPSDSYVDVVDPGGGKVRHWDATIEMDDSVFPSSKCIRLGSPCTAYEKAQMKFVFGLVHEVRRFKAMGGPMPKWWLIKDDDTFVHADALMSSIASLAKPPDPMLDLVGFAHLWCWLRDKKKITSGRECGKFITGPKFDNFGLHWPYGGSGILLSNALAEDLVLRHGDEWIKSQAKYIRDYRKPHYDAHLSHVIPWIHGAKIFHHPPMRDTSLEPNEKCIEPMATLHMRGMQDKEGVDGAIARVVECLEQRQKKIPEVPKTQVVEAPLQP